MIATFNSWKLFQMLSFVCSMFSFLPKDSKQILSFFRVNGIECMVGCDRIAQEKPPTIGSVITVKHAGSYSNGKIRNAFFWNQHDITEWNQLSSKSRTLVTVNGSF